MWCHYWRYGKNRGVEGWRFIVGRQLMKHRHVRMHSVTHEWGSVCVCMLIPKHVCSHSPSKSSPLFPCDINTPSVFKAVLIFDKSMWVCLSVPGSCPIYVRLWLRADHLYGLWSQSQMTGNRKRQEHMYVDDLKQSLVTAAAKTKTAKTASPST